MCVSSDVFFGGLCPELWFVCVVPTKGYIFLHLQLNKTPILKIVLSFYALKTKPGVHVSFCCHVLCLTPPNPLDPLKDLPCSEHVHHYPRVTLSTLVNFLMTLPNVNSLRKAVEGRGDVPAPSKRCQLNPKGGWIGTILAPAGAGTEEYVWKMFEYTWDIHDNHNKHKNDNTS